MGTHLALLLIGLTSGALQALLMSIIFEVAKLPVNSDSTR
jgi:hypothetical protein